MQERTRRPSHRGNTGGPDRALQRRERIPFPVSCRPDPTVRPAATRSSPTTLPCPLRRGSNERRGCPPQPRRSFIACAGRGRPDAGDRRAITGGITRESPGNHDGRPGGPDRPLLFAKVPTAGDVSLAGTAADEPSVSVSTRCCSATQERPSGHCGPLAVASSHGETAAWCAPPQRRCGSPGAWFRPHTWHIGIL